MMHITHHRRYPRIVPVTLATLLALTLPPATTRSQTPTGPPCGDRVQVIETLHKQFGERLVGSGLSDAGTVFEIFAGLGGGWTIIATDAHGKSCLVATGQAWESERWPHLQTSEPSAH